MGLIGCILQPIYLNIPAILMSPLAFLRKPYRWLKAMSDYKATIGGGPNFGYDLCIRKISPDLRVNLDLSCWRIAFNGAEPIRATTIDRFVDIFAPYGFRRESFYPCYGLAESTLFASCKNNKGPPVIYLADSKAIENHRIKTHTKSEGEPLRLVSSGRSQLNQKIIIANPDNCTLSSADRVGEIWISGPNVAQGYWGLPGETEKMFCAYLADTSEGPFLRTGDLGFFSDGELIITGRLKDLIIIRGRNYYPQDIEFTMEKCHPAMRLGCGVAFSIEENGKEQLVLAQEVYPNRIDKLNANEVCLAVVKAVSRDQGINAYTVLLVEPRTLPKTSSGKIQRRASKTMYRTNSLKIMSMWTRKT
jgi:acyl-CoA synthetase (AMP-forming)/AMP-acid ligase II